jgi:hypothetical protein
MPEALMSYGAKTQLSTIVTFVDSSAGQTYYGTWDTNGNVLIYSTGSTYLGEALTSSTTPFTWASGDYVSITGFYEIA